jgi:hypothetical protein
VGTLLDHTFSTTSTLFGLIFMAMGRKVVWASYPL